jgi:hypothetical protein
MMDDLKDILRRLRTERYDPTDDAIQEFLMQEQPQLPQYLMAGVIRIRQAVLPERATLEMELDILFRRVTFAEQIRDRQNTLIEDLKAKLR